MILSPETSLLSTFLWTCNPMSCFNSVHFSTVEDIPDHYFRKNKTITGKVITVHDGDGFRVFHEAERGICSLFSSGKSSIKRGIDLRSNTLNIRLAGIDAPEIGKNGNAGQPFAEESRSKLKNLVEGQTVYLKLMQRDQYGRAVAIVTIPKFFIFNQDISLTQLEKGLAVVYHGKDAVFGGNKKLYNEAESKAKKAKKGIWSQKNFATPGEYKKAMKDANN